MLSYAVGIVAISELVYKSSKLIDEFVPIHIEVLLPAFVLGSIMAYPGRGASGGVDESDAHSDIETPAERRVSTIVAALFMVRVGLSMPKILKAGVFI